MTRGQRQLNIGFYGRQGVGHRSVVPLRLELGCHIFGSTKVQACDLVQVGIDVIHAAQPLQQCQGGFLPDTRHTGNIVHLVAHQGQKIDDQLRGNAKLLQHPRLIHDSFSHGVNQRHMRVNQLGHILIARGDNHIEALLTGLTRQGANHIIGLHPGFTNKGQAHGFDNFVYGLDLLAQLIGHGRTVCFVIRIHVIPEGFSLGVKNSHQRALGVVLLQPPEHIDHALDRPGRLTF